MNAAIQRSELKTLNINFKEVFLMSNGSAYCDYGKILRFPPVLWTTMTVDFSVMLHSGFQICILFYSIVIAANVTKPCFHPPPEKKGATVPAGPV